MLHHVVDENTMGLSESAQERLHVADVESRAHHYIHWAFQEIMAASTVYPLAGTAKGNAVH